MVAIHFVSPGYDRSQLTGRKTCLPIGLAFGANKDAIWLKFCVYMDFCSSHQAYMRGMCLWEGDLCGGEVSEEIETLPEVSS